jgi:hypothetical protein
MPWVFINNNNNNNNNNMRLMGNRTIKVNKAELIKQIKGNKQNHIIEYGKAVTAYKIEGTKQLLLLLDSVDKGSLKASLNLTSPVNNSENYDKIVDMFTWEVSDEVELTQDEFKEYVQDDTSFSRNAKFANMSYTG